MRSCHPSSLLALLILLPAWTAGCRNDSPAAAPLAAKSAAPPAAVRTASSSPTPAPPARPGWIGVVVARESVDVKADSQGRLQSMRVSIGDQVRKGDPLATLDTSLAAQDLEMARSVLSGSQADLRRASAELAEAVARNDRRQKNPDFFSKEDLAQAALQAKTAQSAYEVARSHAAEQEGRVRQLQTTLSHNEIRAPFDGRVAARFVDPGAVVGPGSPLVRLISAGDLLVRAAVPPEEARRLKVGDPVAIDVRAQGFRIAGILQRIAPEVDAASQMVLIEVRLAPAPGTESRLQTGLVVDVRPRQG